MRQYKIRVLIDLVGILRAEARLCCEGELCYTVVKLLLSGLCVGCLCDGLWGGDLTGNRGSHCCTISTLSSFRSTFMVISMRILSLTSFFWWQLPSNIMWVLVVVWRLFSIFIDLCQVTLHLPWILIKRTVSLDVLFAYLKRFGRCSQLMRCEWAEMLLFRRNLIVGIELGLVLLVDELIVATRLNSIELLLAVGLLLLWMVLLILLAIFIHILPRNVPIDIDSARIVVSLVELAVCSRLALVLLNSLAVTTFNSSAC